MAAAASRSFARADLPELLALVSQTAHARLPGPAYLMTSDVAWRLPGSAPRENLRLWHDASGLAGFVWFDAPTGFDFELRADLGCADPIAVDMLAWAEARRRELPPAYPRFVDLQSMDEWQDEVRQPRPAAPDDGLCLTAVAFESDGVRIDLLERHGYRPTRHFQPDYRRPLDETVPAPRLEPGQRLRHTGPGDLEQRVACHRDAWLGSSYDRAQHEAVCSSAVYDPELDIVLETEDGQFASYCICWTDPQVGVGSFEPVGTRPAWRGKGVGREVIHEGLRRLRDRGMHGARVSTAGFNTPAQGLYRSCGFAQIDTLRTFLKRLD